MSTSTQEKVRYFTEHAQRLSKSELVELNDLHNLINREAFKEIPTKCAEHISRMWGLAHAYGEQAKKAKQELLKALENDSIR